MRVWVEVADQFPLYRVFRELDPLAHEVDLPQHVVMRYEQAAREFWAAHDELEKALPRGWSD